MERLTTLDLIMITRREGKLFNNRHFSKPKVPIYFYRGIAVVRGPAYEQPLWVETGCSKGFLLCPLTDGPI